MLESSIMIKQREEIIRLKIEAWEVMLNSPYRDYVFSPEKLKEDITNDFYTKLFETMAKERNEAFRLGK